MAFLDHLIDQNSRWDWAYAEGTGYNLCPVNDASLGDTICELGITDATSDSAYSDGNLRETSEAIGASAYVYIRLKLDTLVMGTRVWGMWNGNLLSADCVWFQWASDSSDAALRGLRCYVIDAGTPVYISSAITAYDLTEYHSFRVVRASGSANFYIDGDLVGTYTGTMPGDDMRLETWIDNSYFVSGVRYYEASAANRHLWVDWVAFDQAEPDLDVLGTGQLFPTAAVTSSESDWADNDWSNPTNIYADDGNTASITASSYDSPDQSYVLKGYNFDSGISLPAGATIRGIVLRINCWYANGTGSLDLVQLLDTSRARGGTNMASTPIALTTETGAIITIGAYDELMGNSLTEAWCEDTDFGVALGFLATGSNTDIFVDSITLELYYEESTAEEYYQAAAGALTASGGIVRAAQKGLSGSLAGSGGIGRAAQKGLSGSLTGSGVMARFITKIPFWGSLTLSGQVRKQTAKVFSGAVTAAGVIFKSSRKQVAGTLTTAGAITKLVGKVPFLGSLTAAGQAWKRTAKAFSGAVTAVGALSSALIKLLAIGGSLTPAGVLQKLTGKLTSGSVGLSGVIRRAVSKMAGGAVTAAGSTSKQTAKAFGGSLTAAGLLESASIYLKAVFGSLSPAGLLSRRTRKQAAGTLAASGGISKRVQKVLSGVLTGAGSLATVVTGVVAQAVGGVLAAAGSLARMTSKQTGGQLAPAGSIIKQIRKRLAGSLSAIGALIVRALNIPTPDKRTLAINWDDRHVAILFEDRGYAIERGQVFAIGWEDRALAIEIEDRKLAIISNT